MARPALRSAFLIVLGMVACSDAIGPDEARYLGPLMTADMGFEGENPALLQTGRRSWTLRLLTAGSCPFVRSEAEVIHRERVIVVFPYEIRKLCGERPIRSGLHELRLSPEGEGPWSIYVMGDGGVQWADTVSPRGR